MALQEINFDGIIGPSHNYAGLSLGNLASGLNKGSVSNPKAAALQGIDKMRHNLELGLGQGFFLPLPRPDHDWLSDLGTTVQDAPATIRPAAFSASAMWAANAATVSPAPDTVDGRCHLTVANLRTMPHRSHEWADMFTQLRLAFGNSEHFRVHRPIPPAFGDEGAANHMRLGTAHDAPSVEVFVFGLDGGTFPARQHVEASRAVARHHQLDDERTLFVAQSSEAIAAGAFHNDVVAVANENVLLCHEQAFADRSSFYAALHRLLPQVEIVEVPTSAVSLVDAVRSYMFNAQLVTLPQGGMGLILPQEARDTPSVWRWLEQLAAGNGPIRELFVVDVRQSMANGGGPACLRLRVVAEPDAVDPRFIADDGQLDAISEVIEENWPDRIAPEDLNNPDLWEQVETAREVLLEKLDLGELD